LSYQDFLAAHKSESPFTLLDRLVRESLTAPDQARAKLEKVLYILRIIGPHDDHLGEADRWPLDVYDPEFGDTRVCKCGHMYYRHFNTDEGMTSCGCKYCGCGVWEAPDLVQLAQLGEQAEEARVVALLLADGVCHDCGASVRTPEDAHGHATGMACIDRAEDGAFCPYCEHDHRPDGPISAPHAMLDVQVWVCVECGEAWEKNDE
jgi:hypothetical protein